jgi:FRG domain
MLMSETIVESFGELHAAIQNYNPNTFIFRGMTAVDYALRPSIWRAKPFREGRTIEEEEPLMFEKFKQRAGPFLQYQPSDEWDWLALAQHHGLHTRLLDWTRNPLVAGYFAVEDDRHQDDSVIYAVKGIPKCKTEENHSPLEVDQVWRFVPRHVSPRLAAQAGLFSIHPSPSHTLPEGAKLSRIVIRSNGRRELKRNLFWYGIHEASLFPSLEGLCRHLNWSREDTGMGRSDETSAAGS